MKRLILIFLLAIATISTFAQTETDLEREFIYRGRQYVPHSPWWTVGFGYGYNIGEKDFEPNFMLDVHFRIMEKHYIGAGYMTSRTQFLDKNGSNIFLPHSYVKNSVNSLHVLYGWRKEKLFHNFGAFIGPSFNWGYDYLYTDTIGDFHKGYMEPGLYASLQYSRKFYYDLGMGITLWASINKSYQVAGLTIHFYFSTAFKRELR